jgi:hypothetical protein
MASGSKSATHSRLPINTIPTNIFQLEPTLAKLPVDCTIATIAKKFEEYVQEGADTISTNASITPSFHRVRQDWVGEVKVLYHIEADKNISGVESVFWCGLGGEEKRVSNMIISITFKDLVSEGSKIISG